MLDEFWNMFFPEKILEKKKNNFVRIGIYFDQNLS